MDTIDIECHEDSLHIKYLYKHSNQSNNFPAIFYQLMMERAIDERFLIL